jgi:hypothetical protein
VILQNSTLKAELGLQNVSSINQVARERAFEKKTITEKNSTRDTVIYPVVRPSNTCLLPHCDVPMDEGCTQPLSSDLIINLNTTVFSFRVLFPFVRNLHKLEPLTLTLLITQKSTEVREGKQHTQDSNRSNYAHKLRSEHKTWRKEFTTQMVLKSLIQRIDCVLEESGSLRMISESLVFCSMRLGVPFIALRQLGVVGDQLGRQILPSVEWCTGQSGAPRDMNSSCPVRDLFPFLAKPTVGSSDPLAHRILSGAHRTLLCDYPTVGSATCRPLITQTTVCRGCLWLTGQSGDF